MPASQSFSQIQITGHAGLPLAAELHGPADGLPVVFAHGFGQTRLAWRACAREVAAAGFRALSFDARGHGQSGRNTDTRYDFAQFVDDLAAVADHCGAAPIIVGASMGGLLSMRLQAVRPMFRAMVLVDITPRWESRGVERILTFMRAHPDGFTDVAEAAAAVAEYLPHRARRDEPERLQQLLVADGSGRLRWHWDPRLLDEVADGGDAHIGALLEAARSIRVPVRLISGGRSDVVSEETIREFMGLVPHAEHVCLPDATHMVAGDLQDLFARTIVEFLDTFRRSPAVPMASTGV